MDTSVKIKWLDNPEKHDYQASESYLNLIYDENHCKEVVKKLEKISISNFKAKDIFRSSGLPLLGVSNYHVAKDTDKIKAGISLSPILLVRDSVNGKVIIADGYHRLCALYKFNEDSLIPCKIVSL